METQRIRLLGIAGSLRRQSWNRQLLLSASKLAPEGFAIEVYARLDEVPLFNEDLEATPPMAVKHLRAAADAADALLLATPEYNHSLPAVMKNAVDWLSRPKPNCLKEKPVAIVGATTGNWGTRLAQAALRQTLTATGAQVLSAPMLFVARVASCFDEKGQLSDASVAESLAQVLVALRALAERTDPKHRPP
jgi:chromate reductase, NAD(P)H dehydrogenase (quinone)